MFYLSVLLVLISAYVIGSIPFGLIVVKITNGKDVRTEGSGRTGGTNVMRAAGPIAGLITAILDVSKGIATGYMVDIIYPGSPWIKVFAISAMIFGSIRSIFLLSRDSQGHLQMHGGAGGATTLGGAMALWFPSVIFLFSFGFLVYLIIGYASVATISIALGALGVFLWRASLGISPREYVIFGALAILIVLYALRPNLRRLQMGTERAVGLRAYYQKRSTKSIYTPSKNRSREKSSCSS